jgi:hypothetical protein
MSAASNPTLWSRYISVVGSVDRTVNYALGEWGALVAQRPILTMVTSFVVSLGLVAGLALIADNVEGASEKLWCGLASLRALCLAGATRGNDTNPFRHKGPQKASQQRTRQLLPYCLRLFV